MAFLSRIVIATRAVIHDATDLPGMIACIPRCTPNAGHAKLTTPARRVIKGAIHPPPSMATAHFYTPTLCFCMENSGLNVFIRVAFSLHDQLHLY
jgi:hypothetical protein